MPAATEYVQFVKELMTPLGRMESHSMFGGHALDCDGTIFAIIIGGVLYLKTDERNRPAYESRGLRPFRPYPGKTTRMPYYEAPPEIFEDPAAMAEWAGGAIAASRRQAILKK